VFDSSVSSCSDRETYLILTGFSNTT
jgi:hypothetical protein